MHTPVANRIVYRFIVWSNIQILFHFFQIRWQRTQRIRNRHNCVEMFELDYFELNQGRNYKKSLHYEHHAMPRVWARLKLKGKGRVKILKILSRARQVPNALRAPNKGNKGALWRATGLQIVLNIFTRNKIGWFYVGIQIKFMKIKIVARL